MATDTPSDNNLASRSLVIAAVIAVLIVGAGAYALWPESDTDQHEAGASPSESDDLPLGFPNSVDGAVAAGAQLLELTLLSNEARPPALEDFVPDNSFESAPGVWSGGAVIGARVESSSDVEVVVRYWLTIVVGDESIVRTAQFFTVRAELVRSDGEWRISALGSFEMGAPGTDDENSIRPDLLAGWWLLDHQGYRAVEVPQ